MTTFIITKHKVQMDFDKYEILQNMISEQIIYYVIQQLKKTEYLIYGRTYVFTLEYEGRQVEWQSNQNSLNTIIG